MSQIRSRRLAGPVSQLPLACVASAVARNTVTHRAPKTSFAMLTSDMGREAGVTRRFPLQPGWAETEAWLKSLRNGDLFGMMLKDGPTGASCSRGG